jgi:hypothetical protein
MRTAASDGKWVLLSSNAGNGYDNVGLLQSADGIATHGSNRAVR